MLYRIFLFACIFSVVPLLPPDVLAFEGTNVKFKKLSIEQGMPGVSVQSICQDRLGLMWFGVEGSGVTVYDGRSFTLYKNNDRDSNSISNNFVTRIVEDKEGTIWLATLNGLNRFDAGTNNFHRFITDVNNVSSLAGNYLSALMVHSNGTLWVGTENGVSIYDPVKNRFHNLFFVPYGSSDARTSIYEVYQDNKLNVWIGTQNNGVYLIKKESVDRFMERWSATPDFPLYNGMAFDQHFSVLEPLEVGIIPDQAWTIEEDHIGNIWIGTLHGIWVVDSSFNDIKKYSFPKGASEKLNRSTINSLYFDAYDVLWCGATSEGLALINTRTNNVTYYSADYSTSSNLKSNSIRSIYEDKGGLVWIATKFDGCNIYDRRQNNFGHIVAKDGPYDGLSNEFVMCLYEDDKSNVWIGTKYGGINKWDRKNKSFSVFHNNMVYKGKKYSNRIQAIGGYKNGLFVGTDEYVEWFEHSTGKVEEMFNGVVYSLVLNNDRLYAATSKGVRVFDPNTRKELVFESKHAGFMQSVDFLINRIYIDKYRRIWFGSRSNGLFLYEFKNDQLMRFFHQENDTCSLSGDMIREIMEDSRGNLWVGTKASGLNRYDEGTRCFVRADAKGALSGKTIYNILEDKDGNLWMGTHDGIVKYNPTIDEAEGYNLDYGLQGKVYELNGYLKLSDGTMLMGGQNGLNVFRPENIARHRYVAPMLLTKFKVFDEVRASGVSQNEVIELTRKDNYISFEFALLDYSAPLQNQYAYQLVGVDKDWVYSGNRNYVSYTNLPPGKYVFMVKGANVDGIWNEKGITLSIMMPEPFYLKTWFLISLAVFLFIMVMLSYYIRIRAALARESRLKELVRLRTVDLSEANKNLQQKSEQILFQNQELELHRKNLEALVRERTVDLEQAKEKAEQSDHLKSAFLANMSHEIRTPLNAILGFSSLLASESIEAEDFNSVNDIIQTNGNSLLQLINDILDVSMIEANQVEISKQPFPVYLMVSQLYDEMVAIHKTQGKHHDLSLHVEFDDSLDQNTFIISDQRRLRQIILNLINNALKFTIKGAVTIGYRVDRDRQRVVFYVRDTGVGIAEEYRGQIFERFRKIEYSPAEVHRGTGLGLSISQNFVNLLGGNIWVESELGVGSVFYFDIPLEMRETAEMRQQQDTVLELSSAWSGKTVLVAEDEDSNFLVIKSMLKSTGIDIVRANNGQEAVEFFMQASTSFHLVLMDIKMPFMSGSEATRIIKSKYDIPILAQTAFATSSEVSEFMAAGFDAYLLKPLNQQELVGTMAKYIR